MKHTLFYIAVSLFFSSLIASFLSPNVDFILCFLLILFLPPFYWIFKDRFYVKFFSILFIVSSLGILSYSFKNMYFNKLLSLDSKNVSISGTITSYPNYTDKKVFYDVHINYISIEDFPHSFNARLYLNDNVFLEPYSNFKADVQGFSPYLVAPDKLKRYYKSKNQAIAFFNSRDLKIQSNKSYKNHILSRFILDSKQMIKDNLTMCYSNDQGNLMVAFLLGDKSHVDYLTKRIFNLAGISHLLAVSGLHLTILIQSVFYFLKSLKLGNKKSIVISVLFTMFFISLTGFSPSALRAGLMNITLLIGLLFERDADSLNSLGIGLIIILMVNPLAAIDIGLQLSFVATLGLIIFKPKVYKFIYRPSVNKSNVYISRIYQYFCDVIAVSISAMVFTAPIIIIAFERISIIAPLTNLVLTPIIAPTLIFIALTALFGAFEILNPFYKFFGLLSSVGMDIIKGVANFMATIPLATISVNMKFLYVWAVFSIGLFLLYKFFIKNLFVRKFLMLFIFIIFLVGKLSNDIFVFSNVYCKNINEASHNQLIYDSKVSCLILKEYDKFLVHDIDEAINFAGINHLNYIIIDPNFDLDTALKLISLYKPSVLVSKSNVIDSIKLKITDCNINLNCINFNNNTFILQKNLFLNQKTLLYAIDDQFIITNYQGRLNILKV